MQMEYNSVPHHCTIVPSDATMIPKRQGPSQFTVLAGPPRCPKIPATSTFSFLCFCIASRLGACSAFFLCMPQKISNPPYNDYASKGTIDWCARTGPSHSPDLPVRLWLPVFFLPRLRHHPHPTHASAPHQVHCSVRHFRESLHVPPRLVGHRVCHGLTMMVLHLRYLWFDRNRISLVLGGDWLSLTPIASLVFSPRLPGHCSLWPACPWRPAQRAPCPPDYLAFRTLGPDWAGTCLEVLGRTFCLEE